MALEKNDQKHGTILGGGMMKTITLFLAFERATWNKQRALTARSRNRFGDGLSGIAVHKDEYALEYQRADRQTITIRKEILRRLR